MEKIVFVCIAGNLQVQNVGLLCVVKSIIFNCRAVYDFRGLVTSGKVWQIALLFWGGEVFSSRVSKES